MREFFLKNRLVLRPQAGKVEAVVRPAARGHLLGEPLGPAQVVRLQGEGQVFFC